MTGKSCSVDARVGAHRFVGREMPFLLLAYPNKGALNCAVVAAGTRTEQILAVAAVLDHAKQHGILLDALKAAQRGFTTPFLNERLEPR